MAEPMDRRSDHGPWSRSMDRGPQVMSQTPINGLTRQTIVESTFKPKILIKTYPKQFTHQNSSKLSAKEKKQSTKPSPRTQQVFFSPSPEIERFLHEICHQLGVGLVPSWTRFQRTLIVPELRSPVGYKSPLLGIRFSDHASHAFIPLARFRYSASRSRIDRFPIRISVASVDTWLAWGHS
uniref:Uncharacterized protein n=1 Tax=Solanum tuberosum TaxID=4113 RepID=M1DE31_SOLTU